MSNPKTEPETADDRRRAAAARALKEAELRRARYDAAADAIQGEEGGPNRLEPTRFGDWEKKGLISDF